MRPQNIEFKKKVVMNLVRWLIADREMLCIVLGFTDHESWEQGAALEDRHAVSEHEQDILNFS